MFQALCTPPQLSTTQSYLTPLLEQRACGVEQGGVVSGMEWRQGGVVNGMEWR